MSGSDRRTGLGSTGDGRWPPRIEGRNVLSCRGGGIHLQRMTRFCTLLLIDSTQVTEKSASGLESRTVSYFGSQFLRSGVGLPLLLLVAFGGCRGPGERRDLDRVLRILGEARTVEPRLSLSAYAPCAPPAQSARVESSDLIPEPGCPKPHLSRPARNRVLRKLEELSKKSNHLASSWAVLLGDIEIGHSPQRLRSDVDRIESSLLHNGTGSSTLFSDLSAAYLLLSQRQDDPLALVYALRAADRAKALEEAGFAHG